MTRFEARLKAKKAELEAARELVEFKPRSPKAVYGVRNKTGSYRAYVYDLGEETPKWADRYTIEAISSGEPMLGYEGTSDFEEAKAIARRNVKTLLGQRFLRKL